MHVTPTRCAWYVEAFGIEFDAISWARFVNAVDHTGSTFELFPHSSTYIGEPDRQSAMVNFLVNDLDGIIERLAEHGATAETIDDELYGRFTWRRTPKAVALNFGSRSLPNVQ